MSEIKEIELQPDPVRAIESLRDTGYSFNTAIADIVDNSIAANAKTVIIDVKLEPTQDIRPIVTIADDGCGMDQAGLENAMRYGSKARTDPNSLGKFGLGLKTASTAFCRKLSVISRGTEDTLVRKMQWDLDHVARTGKWIVQGMSATADEIEILDAAANSGTGTLVMWENVDRLLQKSYEKRRYAEGAIARLCDGLRFHLGAVFQRFIDARFNNVQNVKIILNGNEVEAWDPFCIGNPNTDVLTQNKATKVQTPSGEAYVKLMAYAIPRRESFSTPAERERARISTDTLGIYVYRENRLIHYGDWLGMFKVEPHDSLLRVEFSFDSSLDEYFNIDIKKSRVQLAEELYNFIKDKFLPPYRRAANQKYRQEEQRRIAQTTEQVHVEANRSIDEHAEDVEQATITVTDPGNNVVQVTNRNGTYTHTIVIEPDPPANQCRVIPKDGLRDGVLWEPCIADQKHAVQINTAHEYYKKIYYPLHSKNFAVIGMDSLLWALAEAEHGTYNERVKGLYEQFRIMVSAALRDLIRDLPDPDLPETADEGQSE